MTDRPTLDQLLEAVLMHLETQIIPAVRAEPRLYFQTLVAANVLKIARREGAHGQELLIHEWASLGVLTGDNPPLPTDLRDAAIQLRAHNRALCADIRAGKYANPADSERLAAHVAGVVARQLQINNPALAKRLKNEDESGQHPS